MSIYHSGTDTMCGRTVFSLVVLFLNMVNFYFTDGTEEVLVFPPPKPPPSPVPVKNYSKPEILSGPANLTAFLGDRVELRCRVSGNPTPTVIWSSKREGNLANVGPNFRIHRNNSLSFRRVEKRDESYYVCEAKNSEGIVKSDPARLTVEGTYYSFFI